MHRVREARDKHMDVAHDLQHVEPLLQRADREIGLRQPQPVARLREVSHLPVGLPVVGSHRCEVVKGLVKVLRHLGLDVYNVAQHPERPHPHKRAQVVDPLLDRVALLQLGDLRAVYPQPQVRLDLPAQRLHQLPLEGVHQELGVLFVHQAAWFQQVSAVAQRGHQKVELVRLLPPAPAVCEEEGHQPPAPEEEGAVACLPHEPLEPPQDVEFAQQERHLFDVLFSDPPLGGEVPRDGHHLAPLERVWAAEVVAYHAHHAQHVNLCFLLLEASLVAGAELGFKVALDRLQDLEDAGLEIPLDMRRLLRHQVRFPKVGHVYGLEQLRALVERPQVGLPDGHRGAHVHPEVCPRDRRHVVREEHSLDQKIPPHRKHFGEPHFGRELRLHPHHPRARLHVQRLDVVAEGLVHCLEVLVAAVLRGLSHAGHVRVYKLCEDPYSLAVEGHDRDLCLESQHSLV
mmetsp:Transcript_27129/g.68825  ORF Transcript_27129/g.68825 Transcript_27129/m.68825 type:complete len:458 (-) Transcript_27129:197-1570(-)